MIAFIGIVISHTGNFSLVGDAKESVLFLITSPNNVQVAIIVLVSKDIDLTLQLRWFTPLTFHIPQSMIAFVTALKVIPNDAPGDAWRRRQDNVVSAGTKVNTRYRGTPK